MVNPSLSSRCTEIDLPINISLRSVQVKDSTIFVCRAKKTQSKNGLLYDRRQRVKRATPSLSRAGEKYPYTRGPWALYREPEKWNHQQNCIQIFHM